MNIKLYEKAFAAAGVLGILATTGLAYCNYRFIENLKTPEVRRVFEIQKAIKDQYPTYWAYLNLSNLGEQDMYSIARNLLELNKEYDSLTAKPEVQERLRKIHSKDDQYMSLLASGLLSIIGLGLGRRQLRKSLEDSLSYLTRRRK